LRALALGRTYVLALAIVSSAALAIAAAPAGADTGGAGIAPPLPSDTGGGVPPANLLPPTTPLPTAQLSPDGHIAIPPASAPDAVKAAIYAANKITRKPYRYGGGHRSFEDTAYDCSGSVSYALHGGGLLASPLPSSSLMRWGLAGRGAWITVYTNPGHAFAVIAGLRFDTSGPGASGPRWRRTARISRGAFRARHPIGL
jgi:cell wall-associated NlpC family hydrolase